MSFFSSKKSRTKPEYTGIQGQTSASTLCVPLCWGMARGAPNLFWYGDFASHKVKQKTGKGFSQSATSYTYSASLQMGLCQGPITSVTRVWKDQAKYASYTDAALGFSLFVGSYPQAPWGYLTTNHPTEALGYPGTAHLDVANYNLGNANTIGNHSFEIQGLEYNTQVGGAGDADPALVVQGFLTDPTYSGIFPAASLDTDTLLSGPDATTTGDSALQTYCRAMGFGLSPFLADQEAASSVLDRWTKILNTAVVWTGYALKLIPYGDEVVTGNGVTFLPPTTVRYALTDDDYIRKDNEDPILLSRGDPADAMNAMKLEFRDRSNEYNPAPIQWKDQGLIDLYGLREDGAFQAHEVCERAMGTVMLSLMGQRRAYIRNTYRLSLPPAFCRLEPMDIVTCYDPRWGTFPVRVVDIEEDDDNQLILSLEEFPAGTASSVGFSGQPTTNTPQNTATPAGPVNPPIIFEPRSDLSGGVAQVWVAVSGGDGTTYDPNWGGCFVWLSTDGGVTYQQVGQQDTPARMGKLTAILAAYPGANPDTVNTLAVNLAMSNGDLVGVTSAEAADAVTLCYIGGELGSYMDATLTSVYHYDLNGELYRALYGTTAPSHAIGQNFARLDDNIFKFDLPKTYIGNSIFVKFQSYNIYGDGLEDLSTVVAYPYSPVGTGFGAGSGGVPSAPTGLIGTGGVQSASVQWNANPATDGVISYKLYRALGTGAVFGSAVLIATVTGQFFFDPALASSQGYTYFIVATNTVGDSLPSAGANATTTATVGRIVRWYGSLDRKPEAGEELFDIEMVGDEFFAAGLVYNLGSVDVAAASTAVFNIYHNGVLIGTATVAAAGTTMTWAMAADFAPVSGDRLRFNAPTAQDATLSGPRYTWIGIRN
jgi:hypothetical protein